MKKLLLPVAIAFLVSACPTLPDPVRPTVTDETTFLGLAVVEASRIADPLARSELYRRIAAGYRAIDDEPSMVSLATTGQQLARAAGATETSIRIRLGLAPLLASAGDDAAALAALEAGLLFASTAQDAQVRAVFLPLVVQSALLSDEPARPLLRNAVDEVYVIEDPAYRAEALIRIAELYQASEAALSVSGFLNQAIPAVRSTPVMIRRAELFVRLADLAALTGEQRMARRLLQSVVEEIHAGGVPAGDDETTRLVHVIAELARLGRGEDAVRLLELLPDPYHGALALVAIAPHAESDITRLNRLRDASRRAAQVEDARRFVVAHLAVAEGYQAAGAGERAAVHADLAAQVLAASPDIYSRIDPAARLSRLFVTMDRLQSARDLLLSAPDEYVRGTVAVHAAEQLIADGRMGLADDFLTIALIASDETPYLDDALQYEITRGFARTGSVRLAIRTIERIADELLRAEAVAELAVLAEPAGLVTPIFRADLASVLATR